MTNFEFDFDRFTQSSHAQFNYRVSLTPVQKNILKGDLDSLRLILPYLVAVMETAKVQIALHRDSTDALLANGFSTNHVGRILQTIQALSTATEFEDVISFESILAIEEEIERLSYVPILNCRNLFAIDFGLQFGGYTISHSKEQRSFLESNGYPTDAHANTLIAIDYMLILDLIQIILYPVGRGRKTPRFLPYYPTREIVRLMTRRYSQAIRLCSILELDRIDFSTFTAAQFVEVIKEKGIK